MKGEGVEASRNTLAGEGIAALIVHVDTRNGGMVQGEVPFAQRLGKASLRRRGEFDIGAGKNLLGETGSEGKKKKKTPPF